MYRVVYWEGVVEMKWVFGLDYMFSFEDVVGVGCFIYWIFKLYFFFLD